MTSCQLSTYNNLYVRGGHVKERLRPSQTIYRPIYYKLAYRYTRILADSHISRPLKISVKTMIFDTCNNVIIVMRV